MKCLRGRGGGLEVGRLVEDHHAHEGRLAGLAGLALALLLGIVPFQQQDGLLVVALPVDALPDLIGERQGVAIAPVGFDRPRLGASPLRSSRRPKPLCRASHCWRTSSATS